MTKFYWILGAVAVLGIGAVGYTVGSAGAGTAATSPVEVPGLQDPQQLVQMAQGVSKGDEEAPITVIEFADYQCPGCASFAGMITPQIERRLVDTGEVKMVFYDYPITSIHPHAFLAARAARCAEDQGRFWDYHDALFANQRQWSPTTDATDLFVEYAEELGLDVDDFESCLRSDRHADVVTANMRLGEELGIRGTPTVMVSGGGAARQVNQNTLQAIVQAVREVQQELGIDAGADGAEAPDTGSGAGEGGQDGQGG